ncbi:MAG: hypothetical protein WDN30_03105 [Pararobbsia sp.]
MISIRRWLLGWLLGGLLAAMAIATVWVYGRAHEEATELFDFALRELAVSLPSSLDAARLAAEDTLFDELSEEEVGTQVWGRQRRRSRLPMAAGLDDSPSPPRPAHDRQGRGRVARSTA